MYFHIFSRARLMWDQNPKFTPLSETTSIPTSFICGVPPPLPPRAYFIFCVIRTYYLLIINYSMTKVAQTLFKDLNVAPNFKSC